ncbi:MAG: sigma-70 family RNA polymerase sigma factor [Clostridiaceae bacterium]|nr:sigma-70 family RNA polymerase sigma factor [Clostridiaceae bacterium]
MFFTGLFELLANSVFVILRISSSSGAFPKPLTKDEEERCLKLSAAGDINARNTLVEHNLRLVAHIVKKYYSAREDHDDLISIGTVGLIKAVCSFNGEKGARLATYAARCIENAILSQRLNAPLGRGKLL